MELSNTVIDRLGKFASVIPSPAEMRETRLLDVLESDRFARLLDSIKNKMPKGEVVPTTGNGYVLKVTIDDVLCLEEVDLLNRLFTRSGWDSPDFEIASDEGETFISLYVLDTIRVDPR